MMSCSEHAHTARAPGERVGGRRFLPASQFPRGAPVPVQAFASHGNVIADCLSSDGVRCHGPARVLAPHPRTRAVGCGVARRRVCNFEQTDSLRRWYVVDAEVFQGRGSVGQDWEVRNARGSVWRRDAHVRLVQ